MNIYEKLQKCRVELQKNKLKKSGKNKFSGFDYFELSDFLPTVNELFEKYGLFSNFSIGLNGLATLDIIDAEFTKLENINESSIDEFLRQNAYFYKISFTSPIDELELKGCNKIQALGGTHTYMKRYLYMNALEIVETDLFDAMTGSEQMQEIKSGVSSKSVNELSSKKDTFISSEQKDLLKSKLGGAEFAKLMNSNNGKLTIEKFNEIMTQI